MSESVYDGPGWRSFVAAIRAAPDDDLPRLVAADWLDENGEADRAEFVRLQIELLRMSGAVESDDRREAVRVRLSQIIDDGRLAVWLGVDPDWSWSGTEYETRVEAREVEYLVRRGFAAEHACTYDDWLENGDYLCRREPLSRVTLRNAGLRCLPTEYAERWPGVRFTVLPYGNNAAASRRHTLIDEAVRRAVRDASDPAAVVRALRESGVLDADETPEWMDAPVGTLHTGVQSFRAYHHAPCAAVGFSPEVGTVSPSRVVRGILVLPRHTFQVQRFVSQRELLHAGYRPDQPLPLPEGVELDPFSHGLRVRVAADVFAGRCPDCNRGVATFPRVRPPHDRYAEPVHLSDCGQVELETSLPVHPGTELTYDDFGRAVPRSGRYRNRRPVGVAVSRTDRGMVRVQLSPAV